MYIAIGRHRHVRHHVRWGVSGEEIDAAYGLSRGLGLSSYLEPCDQLLLMLGHHRFTMLLIGLVLIVAGRVTARKQ